jgi:transcriptional regulator GlxA family with amidase domain
VQSYNPAPAEVLMLDRQRQCGPAAATTDSAHDVACRTGLAMRETKIPSRSASLAAGAAADVLLALSLAAFSLPPGGSCAAAAGQHHHTLRRAIRFIDENAQRSISAADVARAAHVTVRTVQLAFQQHLGTTPTRYLRAVRLEQARQQLTSADPETTTVTAVAARWGFASHSRFTTYYKAAYGETPSETLRRR